MHTVYLTNTKLKKLSEGKGINITASDMKPTRGRKQYSMTLHDKYNSKFGNGMQNKGKFKLHPEHISGGNIFDSMKRGFQHFGNQAKHSFQHFGNQVKTTFQKAPGAFNTLGKDIKTGYNIAAPVLKKVGNEIVQGYKTYAPVVGKTLTSASKWAPVAALAAPELAPEIGAAGAVASAIGKALGGSINGSVSEGGAVLLPNGRMIPPKHFPAHINTFGRVPHLTDLNLNGEGLRPYGYGNGIMPYGYGNGIFAASVPLNSKQISYK